MKEATYAPMFQFRLDHYRNGELLKTLETHNTVVTVGLNELIDQTFRGGTGQSWFLALKGTGNVAAGDSMTSHTGWAENTAYSNATRIAMSFAAPVGGTSTNAPGTYSMDAAYTVAGAFITSGSAKSGTAGTLYSAGDFATTRTGGTGDTLVVTPTIVLGTA